MNMDRKDIYGPILCLSVVVICVTRIFYSTNSDDSGDDCGGISVLEPGRFVITWYSRDDLLTTAFDDGNCVWTGGERYNINKIDECPNHSPEFDIIGICHLEEQYEYNNVQQDEF